MIHTDGLASVTEDSVSGFAYSPQYGYWVEDRLCDHDFRQYAHNLIQITC